jgi:MYXO-CTERM domain-containing protein
MLSHTLVALTMLGTCVGMPPGDMKSPEYWGDYFLAKYADERAAAMQLEPGPAPLAQPRTVLLITGVTIPAEWFEPIVARLERDGFRPVVYEPPALLSGDLFENSEALAGVIDQIRAQTGEQKIDILAECTGGLIARHYIQALGGDQHVSRLVTFISPQHGVAKAPLAADFAGWPALYDLSPGSEFLETVNNAPLPANVPVTSIYTCTDEYIQPYETSIIPGANNIGLCDEFVGHYQFFYDPSIYLIMHGALTEPVASMPDPNAPTDEPEDMTADDEGGGCSSTGGSAGGVAFLVLGAIVVARRRRSS